MGKYSSRFSVKLQIELIVTLRGYSAYKYEHLAVDLSQFSPKKRGKLARTHQPCWNKSAEFLSSESWIIILLGVSEAGF
jgi:hypothetical protein